MALLIAPLLFVPTSPFLLVDAGRGLQSLVTFTAIFAIVACSLAIPLRFLDLPSGAHAGLFGVGAYASAIVMADMGGGFWIGLLAAVVFASIVGILVGALALRTVGLAFLIITIALGALIALVLHNWSGLTGGPLGFYVTDPPFPFPGFDIDEGLNLYFLVLGFLYLVLGGIWLLARSQFGRRLAAIRDDETLARSLGIATSRQKLTAFALSAAIAGLAGHLYILHLKAITPELFQPFAFIPVFLMVVLGGYRTLAGPAIGAWLVLFLREWLEPLGFDDPTYEQLLFGLLLIVFMLTVPSGLVGWINNRLGDRSDQGDIGEADRRSASSGGAKGSPRLALPPAATGGVLKVNGVSKRYGAVQAVDDVSLSMDLGEIVGVIGPNGSGKTTLLNCISGFETSTTGSVTWGAHDLTGSAPETVARMGIVRTFQQPRFFESYSPREHCEILAEDPDSAEIGDLLQFAGLDLVEDVEAPSLSFGHLRNLAIATALATGLPQVLMLDEPAAGLNNAESEQLRRRLVSLRDSGFGLLVVDHDMPFLLPMCDRVVVLDAGAKIAEGTPDEVRTDPRVVAAYLGERYAQQLRDG